ncbi:MAG TPA: hypothetical protein VIQ60_00275 [Gemmatimonadaceae bacterium]
MLTHPAPDQRELSASDGSPGLFLLCSRFLFTPSVFRTRTILVHGIADIPRNSIVLIEQHSPWPFFTLLRIRFAMRVGAARLVVDRTGAPLVEIEAASAWRLARPFELSEVLSESSAYDGGCPMRRFSNVHELEIRRNASLKAMGLPFDNREMDNEVRALFLRLWSKGKDAPDYDKAEWRNLQTMLDKRGILM